MTENIDKAGPFEKIKQAKELFDMGAITQEEYDNIKNNCLNQLHQSDKEPEIPQEEPQPTHYQESVLDGILGTVLGGGQTTKDKQSEKTESEKMAERAATQAVNAVAREATKEIMRGMFGQMK